MSRLRDGWSILLSLGIGAWSSVPGSGATERADMAAARPPAEPPSRIDIVVRRPDATATLALAQRQALELARDDPPGRQTKL